MAHVTRRRILGALLLALLAACEPLRVVAFHGSEEEPVPGVGLGGAPAVGSGGAVEPQLSWLVDDFEDQDYRANDPGGWWYSVNDGTGTQDLSIQAASDGYVLQSECGTFAEWGSAIGLDVIGYELPASATELEFYLRASRPFEASFHAIDGSGEHFTRPLAITETWTRFVVRLDQMFFVDGDVVRRLDLTTLDELHWFFFESQPVTVWIDHVSLRSF